MRFLRRTVPLLIVLALACGGCASDPSGGVSGGEHADTDAVSVVLIPEDSFSDSGFVPTQVRFGFVGDRGELPEPDQMEEIEIAYDHVVERRTNSAVPVVVPPGVEGFLAYQLQIERLHRNEGFEQPRKYLTEVRYLDLSRDTTGSWVVIPMFESIFSPDNPLPACFEIDVRNRFSIDTGPNGEGFVSDEPIELFGRVTEIIYGFTGAAPEQYCGHAVTEGVTECEHENVAFVDGSGNKRHEDVMFQVSGQTETTEPGGDILMSPGGSLRILPRESATNQSVPIFVRVPDGLSLVYRLKMRRFAAGCTGGDQGEGLSDIFYRSVDPLLRAN